MLRYSCDLCGRELDSQNDLRYVVRMEVYAAFDPLRTDESEDDRDHLEEVQDIIERKAPRPYDLLILSDHGQSFGHTFLQRYNYTLKDFVQRFVPEGRHRRLVQSCSAWPG